jgi:hypothetical protein
LFRDVGAHAGAAAGGRDQSENSGHGQTKHAVVLRQIVSAAKRGRRGPLARTLALRIAFRGQHEEDALDAPL